MGEAVLGPPNCVRILGNQSVGIERRSSPRQERQQKATDRQGLTAAGPRTKRRRIPIVFHARFRCSDREYPTALRGLDSSCATSVPQRKDIERLSYSYLQVRYLQVRSLHLEQAAAKRDRHRVRSIFCL